MEPRGEMSMYSQWMQEDAARQKKWAYLTDGISDATRRRVTEVLLDNEERYLNTPKLFEDVVTTAMVPSFTTFAYPVVRRVFPRLIAYDLVSVQPMTQPTGKVFYFDIEYSASGSPPTNKRVDVLTNRDEAYAATGGEGAAIAELNLRVSSADVSATAKKLKAKWSLEAEQDLQAYYGLNAEGELMTALTDEIAREIDRNIIAELFAAVTSQNIPWDSTQPASGPWSLQSPKEYARTLYDAICDANNLIFKKRYRNATWVVCGADTAARLEKLEAFRLFPAPEPIGTIVTGPHLFGTIAGRFAVYKDPWLSGANADKLLLGFKGTSPLDTGYIYAPYIPLMTTAPFTDPNTLTTVRAMMTRYATKTVIDECYATVTIS